MSLKMKGFEKLARKLERFPRKQAAPAMRKAVRAGTAILKAAVKAQTPVDEGLLKKAQDSKVTVKGFRGFGVVGASVEKMNESHATDESRPTNIDYLVEFGHTTPDGTFVPPSGHMRRAAAEAMPAAEAKATQVLRDAMKALEGA